MKRILALILALLTIFSVAFGVVSCNSGEGAPTDAPTEPPTDAPTEPPTDAPTEKNTEKKTEKSTANADTRPELSVLFIGNSYTYYNSLASIFRTLAAKAGYRVKVTEITKADTRLRSLQIRATRRAKELPTRLTRRTRASTIS